MCPSFLWPQRLCFWPPWSSLPIFTVSGHDSKRQQRDWGLKLLSYGPPTWTTTQIVLLNPLIEVLFDSKVKLGIVGGVNKRKPTIHRTISVQFSFPVAAVCAAYLILLSLEYLVFANKQIVSCFPQRGSKSAHLAGYILSFYHHHFLAGQMSAWCTLPEFYLILSVCVRYTT